MHYSINVELADGSFVNSDVALADPRMRREMFEVLEGRVRDAVSDYQSLGLHKELRALFRRLLAEERQR